MNPLIARIENSLRITTDGTQRALLLARRACIDAREGRFEEAKDVVSQLRAAFGDGRNGEITVLIMLVESLTLWFSQMNSAALDRVARAQFLANALKSRPLLTLTSAWKAYFDFERSDFPALMVSLRAAQANATDSDVDARARMAMVLCSALSLVGEIEIAQEWFQIGRDLALLEGDQATVEALQYNRAVIAIGYLRAERCLHPLDPELLRRVRLEFESARNLQALTRNMVLNSYMPLCDARMLMLEQRYGDAIARLTEAMGQRPFATDNYSEALIHLELALCHFRAGRSDEAWQAFEPARDAVFDQLHLDEQLVAAWLRHELCTADPRFGPAAHTGPALEAIKARYRAAQTELAHKLRSFVDEVRMPTLPAGSFDQPASAASTGLS